MTESEAKLANVMIIDDDDISNFIYTRVVSSSGYVENIHSCKSGREGLESLKNYAENSPESFPELIFLDINMPVMNGWDFLEEYTRIIPEYLQEKTILCVLSSSIYKNDINKAKSFNQVREYVPKPLTKDSLHAIIHKYFS